ncbi:DoxX family protein [bacterium]|nr:DoxX family protein [bacterium]
MKRLDELKIWLEGHRDYAYSVMRIYLGIALFLRGLILLSDPSAITTLAGAQQVYMMYSYIIAGHLIGGFLLTIGFMTRLAALLQIPILVGAVFFIHLQQGLMTVGQSLELAALVLALLVIFFLFGSGIYALDNYVGAKKSETSPAVK